jgi:RHS repeat-associated protein
MIFKFRILCLLCCVNFAIAQNPATINLNSVPTNYAVDSYTRATQKINLTPGFKFEPSANNTNKLLNLSIGSYPSYVSSNYTNPADNLSFYSFDPTLPAQVNNGVYDVNGSGMFNYSIPITIAPGTKGMQPNLVINYSSSGINNWLGKGFNIEGISSITRVPKSLFHDNIKGKINFDADDVFSLDGSRLLLKTGVYGQNNSTYKKELEDYSNITSFTSNGIYPDYFEITTSNGLIMEYGKTVDSKASDVSNTTILSWYLCRVTDEFGNYMKYIYDNSGGEIVLDKIEYTLNNGAASLPFNKVKFSYFNRSDAESFYLNGKEFKRTKILKSITSLDINDQLVKKYSFDYLYNNESLLSKITENDANGNTLNPTYFKWNINSTASPIFNSSSIGGLDNFNTAFSVITADLNGDGPIDAIVIRNNQTADISLSKVTASGFTAYDTYDNINATINLPQSNSNFVSYSVTDEDDDGKDEIYLIYALNISLNDFYYIYKISESGTNNFVINLEKLSTKPSLNNYSFNWWNNIGFFKTKEQTFNYSSFNYSKEDFTGDGLKDKLEINKSSIEIHSSEPSNPSATYQILSTNPVTKSQIGDFDGDGINEVAIVTPNSGNNKVEILAYDKLTNTFITKASMLTPISTHPNSGLWQVPSNMSPPFFFDVVNSSLSNFFGDFNGDGKLDYVVFSYLNSTELEASFYYSNGLNFILNSKSKLPIFLNNKQAYYFVTDINKDGRSDLVAQAFNPLINKTYYAKYISNGFLIESNSSILEFFEHPDDLTAINDFDGDGTLDRMKTGGGGDYFIYNLFSQPSSHLVTAIETIDDKLSIEYKNLPNFRDNRPFNNMPAATYKRSSQSNNSIYKILRPFIYVTSSIISNNRIALFAYENALYNSVNKTFIGFEKYYKLNNQSGMVSITSNTFNPINDDILKVESINGILSSTSNGNFVVNANKIVSQSSVEFVYSLTGSNRFLSSKTIKQWDFLYSTNIETIEQFDNSKGGNLLSSSNTSYLWNTNTPIISNLKNYNYSNHLHFLNGKQFYRILTINSTNSNSSGTSTFQDSYTHDVSGKLTSSISNSDKPALAVSTSYNNYDVFGNPKNVIVNAPDIAAPRSTQYEFDVTGRFNTKITNPLNQITELVYEPKFGNIVQSKNLIGLISSYTYDGLGRLVKEISPNGAINTNKFEWYFLASNSSPFSGSTYGIKATSNNEGLGQNISYYDQYGLLKTTEKLHFGGKVETEINIYDSRNNLIDKRISHFIGQEKQRMLVQYDEFSRPTQSELLQVPSFASITKVEYSYNNLSSLATYNKGFSKIKTKTSGTAGFTFKTIENNEAGQKIKLNNYNTLAQQNISTYVYDNNNNVSQVTNSFNGVNTAVTTFGYDAIARQSNINDPSAGLYSVVLNSLGEMVTRNTPGGSFTYIYDVGGRLVSKNSNINGQTNYQYFTNGNGNGQLQTITGPDINEEFNYDNFGRMTEQKRILITSGNKTFISKYTFNKYNQLVNQTYPNNFVTTNIYDVNGFLSEIKNNNTTIWKLNDFYTPDKINNYDVNNSGINNLLSFDNNLMLTEKLFGSLSKQIYNYLPQNQDLEFRKHENYITNANNNEFFSYDDYDRLTNTKYKDNSNNDVTKHSYTYLENGNLNSKTDCGDYVYANAAKPYLLTAINNPAGNTSLNQLNLTYTNFDKILNITEATTNKEFNFIYDNNEDRASMNYKINGVLQYTRYYETNFDRQENADGSFKEWNYIFAPTGLCAINYNNNGNQQLLYTNMDNLGSPLQIYNSNNTLATEYSFDAWGRRRNPADWNDYNPTNFPAMGGSGGGLLIRGYTMHEHLDEVGIINMSGRIYDPVLGRFLQPDKIIQEPGNLQNHNRYSYVMNNPLKYTDPSGYRATGPGNSGLPPEHNWNHYEHLQTPVLYIDGFRVDKGFGGFAFWLGGGARGGAGNSFSTAMFGFTGGISASYINSANFDYWLANNGSFFKGGPRGAEDNNSPGLEINLPDGSAVSPNSQPKMHIGESFSETGPEFDLPEIEIITYGNGLFSDPSYNLWSRVNEYLVNFDNLNWLQTHFPKASGRLEPNSIIEDIFLGRAVVKGITGLLSTAAKRATNLAVRSDIALSGGRSGQLVKTLTGPANSVVKGGQGRIFITDKAGKVIWDVTKDRAKSVIPGQGFGPKVAPTQEQLNFLNQIWGK